MSFITAERLFSNQDATSVDLTRLFTSNVTDMNHMLADNSQLTQIIGLRCLMVSEVSDMSYMFENDSALTSLDLSALHLNNLENIEGMFKGCSALQELRLTSIHFLSGDYQPLYQQSDIFTGIPDDCHIIVNTDEEATAIYQEYPNLTNVTSSG